MGGDSQGVHRLHRRFLAPLSSFDFVHPRESDGLSLLPFLRCCSTSLFAGWHEAKNFKPAHFERFWKSQDPPLQIHA
ncbi:hypothetical protein MA16_Dca028600 [Dendrobium catenatum]|uniref:Uncharacterized protein n=1 Tax=Dendrobium catenatum TaxID=906689 RepID=A0A2I0VC73_9ASPA|nr:hypothetical protein MA16_Dca028600 [Dendrobium catenatum]